MAITNIERQRNYLTFERAAECFSESINETVGVVDLLNMLQEEVVPLSIWLPVSTFASRCVFKTEVEIRDAESEYIAYKWYRREITATRSYNYGVQITKQYPYSLLNFVEVNKGTLTHSKDLDLYCKIKDTALIKGVFDVTAVSHVFEAIVEGLAIGGGYEQCDMDFLTFYNSSLSQQIKRYKNPDDESMVRVFDKCDIFVLTNSMQVWIDAVDIGFNRNDSEYEVNYEINHREGSGNSPVKTIGDTVYVADTMNVQVAPPDSAFFCIRPESLEILIDTFKKNFNQEARNVLNEQPKAQQKLNTRTENNQLKIINALKQELLNKGVPESKIASIIKANSELAGDAVPQSTVYEILKQAGTQ